MVGISLRMLVPRARRDCGLLIYTVDLRYLQSLLKTDTHIHSGKNTTAYYKYK